MKKHTSLLLCSLFFTAHLYAQTALNIQTNALTFPNYVRTTDTLRILSEHFPQINGVKVKDHFMEAFVPMLADSVTDIALKQEIEHTFTIAENAPFILAEKGTYLLFVDSADTFRTASVFVSQTDFPKYKKLSTLIKCLTYITTDEEYEAIWTATDPNKAFGEFWMKLGTTESKSRALIKEYYKRVTYANEHFTSYKEGWRTDRGMILIVYGYPHHKKLETGRELWYYQRNGKSIIFKFEHHPNKFSDNNYVLKRSVRYKESWYFAIKKWRKGDNT